MKYLPLQNVSESMVELPGLTIHCWSNVCGTEHAFSSNLFLSFEILLNGFDLRNSLKRQRFRDAYFHVQVGVIEIGLSNVILHFCACISGNLK